MGLLHYQSGLTIPAEFDAIIPYNDDLFRFNMGAKVNANGFITGGKWGIMNRKTRQLVLDPDYDFIGDMNPATGVYAVYKGGQYLYNGYVSMPDKNSKGLWALVNAMKQPLTGSQYHSIRSNWPGGFVLRDAKTKLMGMTDMTGKRLLDCVYDTIYNFHSSDSLALARRNGKYGFLHSSGAEAVPFVYEKIADTDFGKDFVVGFREGNSYIVDRKGKELQDPPRYMEDQFGTKLQAANNSKERGLALVDYENALKGAGYSNGHTAYLLGQKLAQVIDIDFYGVFEYLMKAKNISSYRGATSILTMEQRSAIKSLAQYVVDDFVARDKGQSAPAWPNGVPKAGYGWGKTVSSDRVVVTTPAYTAPPKPALTKAELNEMFLGKWYILSVYGYSMRGRVTRIDNEYSILVYFTQNLANSNQDWAFFSADQLKNERQLKYSYVVCAACNGTGMVSSTFRHTNDYSYTLGQKHIYTATSSSSCRSCCGGLRPVDPNAKCEW
ncbi:MAG: WG repeat-containing protein [Chitinophagaceae bacterium]|nr:WG repeat-containing protein [Chitinophagaceae bacterium]